MTTTTERLRELLEKATGLPWRAAESWRPPIGTMPRNDSERRDANGQVFWGYSISGCDERGVPILPTLGAVHNFPDNIHANAALIAEGISALPSLLDEREALVGENRALREENGNLAHLVGHLQNDVRGIEGRAKRAEAQAAALVGEVERLRTGIARAIDALEVEGQFVAAEIVREETDQALSSIKEKSCG